MTHDTREYVVYNGHMRRVRCSRPASKPFEDMSTLRKLTSLKYLSHKVRGWLHTASRDTLAAADDEEEINRASEREIICCEELLADAPKPNCDSHSRRSSIITTRTSDSEISSSLFSSFLNDDASIYEPTKDQRWCRNCNKCFQQQLSHFELYCGLDCKTAHRIRTSI